MIEGSQIGFREWLFGDNLYIVKLIYFTDTNNINDSTSFSKKMDSLLV
jgi:hypothetical protein